MIEIFKVVCSNCLEHPVKWVGGTPSGEQYLCTGRCSWNVTPCKLATDPPDEDVTRCLYCGNVVNGYSNKRTCGAKCRKALSRLKLS